MNIPQPALLEAIKICNRVSTRLPMADLVRVKVHEGGELELASRDESGISRAFIESYGGKPGIAMASRKTLESVVSASEGDLQLTLNAKSIRVGNGSMPIVQNSGEWLLDDLRDYPFQPLSKEAMYSLRWITALPAAAMSMTLKNTWPCSNGEHAIHLQGHWARMTKSDAPAGNYQPELVRGGPEEVYLGEDRVAARGTGEHVLWTYEARALEHPVAPADFIASRIQLFEKPAGPFQALSAALCAKISAACNVAIAHKAKVRLRAWSGLWKVSLRSDEVDYEASDAGEGQWHVCLEPSYLRSAISEGDRLAYFNRKGAEGILIESEQGSTIIAGCQDTAH